MNISCVSSPSHLSSICVLFPRCTKRSGRIIKPPGELFNINPCKSLQTRVKYDTHRMSQISSRFSVLCARHQISENAVNPLSPPRSGVLGYVGLLCPQFVPQEHCVSANNYNIIIQVCISLYITYFIYIWMYHKMFFIKKELS